MATPLRPVTAAPVADRIRPWGLLVADGVVGVVAGALALLYPGITVLTLALLLGIGLLLQGVAQVVAARRAMTSTGGRTWGVLLGVLSLAAGVLCLVQPGAGVFGVLLGVELWFVAAGIQELMTAATLDEDRPWNGFLGVVTLLSAVVLIALPGVALWTAAVLTGAFFLARGAGQIAAGVRLRRSFT